MRIYTKKGDKGYSTLIEGKRLQKSHLVFELLGIIDELNSLLGICTLYSDKKTKKLLKDIQDYIFSLGAYASGFKNEVILESIEKETKNLEYLIDTYSLKIPDLANFILPGGSEGASFLHLSRVVCRRLERVLVDYSKQNIESRNLFKYINRLSDLLFVLARYDNYKHGIKDIIWKIR